jgi:hypothetical protein
MYTRGANGAAVCSSLGCGSTHSRPSRRRNSSEPYPHLMRVRRSRASRSPINHHPPAPVARSRLHANRDPPCRMLITLHLVAQGYVVGHGRRSPCRPKPIVQTRNTRTAPTCSSTSSSNHVSSTRARIEASFSEKELDGRVRLVLLPSPTLTLDREHPTFRRGEARRRRRPRRRGCFLSPM